MAITNRERLARGLELLRAGLVPFMEAQFQAKLGDGFKDVLQTRFDLKRLSDGSLHWDNPGLLKLFLIPDVWKEVLEPVLGKGVRNYAGELLEVRNRHAHDEAFTSEQTERALDTMRLLLVEVSAVSEADQIQQVRYDLQRTVFTEQARQKTRIGPVVEGSPRAGLKPWREVITPHQDVVTGRYVQAEFAADLHSVHVGYGTQEYRDPQEFFRRTFITEGLKDLLANGLARMNGRGGDPVIELQTNFGGGKTHSMLALYHLFSGAPTTDLAGLEPVLARAGVDRAPKAQRAVLVGNAITPGRLDAKPDGTVTRTLWGDLAWQLGGAEGYRMVEHEDLRGISPGKAQLADVLRRFSPCLILIDEWVAFARQIVGIKETPLACGSFDSLTSFAQALTEAAKMVPESLVVVSIPASKIEQGGDNGKYAHDVLKDIVERIAVPWRPASADEGFEIVRRRLFEPIVDKDRFAERDAVVEAFARMYQENKTDFPTGCSEGAYRRKLEAAYPIHPEVFDRLYNDWSSLDKFQRTRGVLRLMAHVIHRLWERNDSGLSILPAFFPMDDSGLISEMTRYLDNLWEPIISAEVDGPNSLPMELDQQNPNLGRYSACRRVARCLYIGTAPGSDSKNPGIDDRQVRLGCAQPGENAATFGDALRRTSDRARHVHQDGNRYWISTKASLIQVADDRASARLQQVEELHAEIVRRIREDHRHKENRGDFAGVHTCPDSSAEVHDEPEARLVILGPGHPHRKGQIDTAALREAKATLDRRGTQQRYNRNMLAFLAPDAARLDDLLQATAYYLAWQSILTDEASLNLDNFQENQAKTKIAEFDKTVSSRIHETWTLALVPHFRAPDPDEQTAMEVLVGWDDVRIAGTDPLAKRTATKLKTDGVLLTSLAGITLRHHLDDKLWKDKDHVQVGLLAEWFGRYLYLPRVVNREVLFGSIRDGLKGLQLEETFAFASGYDEAGKRYKGLVLRGVPVIENTSLLVKPAVAKAQVEGDEEAAAEAAEKARQVQIGVQPTLVETGTGTITKPPPVIPTPPPIKKVLNVFIGSVRLDGARLGRDAGRVAEEVLQHLSTLPGAEVEVRLEVQVRVPAGVPDDVVRTVSENAKTLKFDSAGFERE